jgi:L-ascorbate metabolism protein UlaG (beta-lactamase superfamily)
MGRAPSGERLERLRRSPHYRDGKFVNPVSVMPYSLGAAWQMMQDYSRGQKRVPDVPPPVDMRRGPDYVSPPESGLRVTWLGHSSALLEIDGTRILLDPIFSHRLSPLSFLGPTRFFPSPIALDDLPAIDAVVISHDHYDHLDYPSVVSLGRKAKRFVVPLGVGSHLEYWGVPAAQTTELDWWDETQIAGSLRVVACPARHFSGRALTGDKTLWASFALVGPKSRVFFSGDTGPLPEFTQVGERYGPFDVTLIKVGAYGRTWPGIHVDPEQAVELHQLVRGQLFVPVHWGTVNLSYHAWTEPAERAILAARRAGVEIAIPKPGQMFEPSRPPARERWWPEVPWEPATH